jgi:DNA polymerase kappa
MNTEKSSKVKFVFSGDSKAGMADIDKQHQAKVIYESSKNSAYYHAAEEKSEKTIEECNRMISVIDSMNEFEINTLKKKAETMLASIELQRSFTCVKCVLDMDAFYASVEIRDRPELVDKPVAVGSGVITTCNYIARTYGVRSAMPGFIAKKLCPTLVFLPCNFDKYIEASNIIRNIIEKYDPNMQSHSLDEVYFDITNIAKQRISGNSNNLDEIWAAANEILNEIRMRITKETNGLTCSAGLANNFMLAKIGSNANKPNGQYQLPPTRQDVMNFMMKLPIRSVPGIGKVLEQVLKSLGLDTMGDIQRDFYKVLKLFSTKTALFLANACLGISNDGKEEIEVSGPKSIGRSQTYRTINKYEDQLIRLKEICGELFDECNEKQLFGQTITLKLKTDKFKELTRSKTYPYLIKTLSQLEEAAICLLAAEQPITLRLIGVTLSKLFVKNQNQSEKTTSTSLQHFFNKQNATNQSEDAENRSIKDHDNNINNDDNNSDEFYIFEDYKEINDNDDAHCNDNIDAVKDENSNHKITFESAKDHKHDNTKKKKREPMNILTAFNKSKKQSLDDEILTCWTCEVCTYNHCNADELKFLQCGMCLEPRKMV